MPINKENMMIGWRETASLPDLDLRRFRAKIDTGALTTALHATKITRLEVRGQQWVEFLPDHEVLEDVQHCVLPLLHTRQITNTSGVPEERFIVATTLQIGTRKGRIEVSLTDRSDMRFPIIIGRSALRLLRLTIDPSRSWLQTPRTKSNQGR